MPRTPRGQSESGIYHVMLRGIDRAQLFYDAEDHLAFIERLSKYKEKYGYLLLAYSLMGNHVHMLIREGSSGLSQDIKSLATSYAHWFNEKYDRSGYLFQSRFKSEPITSDGYLLQALHYILNNPVKIGQPITHWTSYNDYISDDKQGAALTDTSYILEMFSTNHHKAVELFIDFVSQEHDNDTSFIDEPEKQRPKDSEAIELIKGIAQVQSCIDLSSMDKNRRDHTLALLKKEGLTIRQLARLTGINRGLVQRAKSE